MLGLPNMMANLCERLYEQGGKEMKTELNINGMHCESCAADIQETLAETNGVSYAQVSYDDRQAIVDYDENTVQQATILKKIQDLGYTAIVAGEAQSGVGA